MKVLLRGFFMYKIINENLVDYAFILDVEFKDKTHAHYILSNSLISIADDDIEESRRGLRYVRDNYESVICLSDEMIESVISCKAYSISNSIKY